MKALQLLILFSIIVLSFTTCRKYPQDGKISFETPDKRLRRVWTLTECLVDGDDVTDKKYTLIYDPMNPIDTVVYTLKDATLEFSYYKTRVNGKIEKVYTCGFNIKNIIKHKYVIPSAGIDYDFSNFKRKITFDTNDKKASGIGIYYSDFPLLFNYTNEPWTIKELIKTKFIIETTNSTGNKIKVTFKGQ